jgi:hypothetical protein
MGITLLTLHDARKAAPPLAEGLQRSADLPQLERMVVLFSGERPPVAHPRLELHPLRGEPTLASLLEHANARCRGGLCLVTPDGVRLDESLAGLAAFDLANTCLVAGPFGDAGGTSSRPCAALAFRAPLPEIAADFRLEAPGALGRLTAELQRARLIVADVTSSLHARWEDAALGANAAPCTGERSTPRLPLPPGPKVIGIGLQRTGTGSLRRALNLLGIPTQEHYGAWFLVRLEGEKLVFDASANHAYFEGYADSPVPLFFREMDARFPGSRFIYTTRGRQSWLKSVRVLFRMKPEWEGTPDGRIYDAYHAASYGTADFDAAAFGQGFDRHHAAVMRHFRDRPGDLLVLDSAEPRPWEKLCPFLGKPVPERPYPHTNRSKLGRWSSLWRR